MPVLPEKRGAGGMLVPHGCLEGGRARSDFAWTTYMTGAILLGGVAERMPGRRHVWNNATRSFDTPEATAILKSRYREGWQLPQLGAC